MLYVPMEVPSREYTHVVPDWRLIEKTCDPVPTLSEPPDSTVLLPRPQI